MTTTPVSVASPIDPVKQALLSAFEEGIEAVLRAADAGGSARELEVQTLEVAHGVGRSLLAEALSARCRRASVEHQRSRGLQEHDVRYRGEDDYRWSVMTTLGRVTFPCWAYRGRAAVGSSTCTPAAEVVLPLISKCKSSPLCVEWEALLASMCPYRTAQQLLRFFSHGSAALEDTTIARHATRIGHAIDQKWLWKTPAQTREILREDAARDRVTGRPVVYVSCDAHALRRYVNESFTPAWKMINGLRAWCVHRRTGRVIHLGGQFICGDARRLAVQFGRVIEAGILPRDGDFGGGVGATYVFVADGMPWISELIISQLQGAVPILDAYHALQRLAEYARAQLGARSMRAKLFLDRAKRLLFGGPGPGPAAEPQYRRKGHRKLRRRNQPLPARRRAALPDGRKTCGRALIQWLRQMDESSAAHAKLVDYFEKNVHRTDYAAYRHHGFQIGSGAMESLHTTGSQLRMKLAGATWLPETIDALLKLRMLRLSGRWEEFFGQSDLWRGLAERFRDVPYHTVRGCPLAA